MCQSVYPETKSIGSPGRAGGGEIAINDKLTCFARDTSAEASIRLCPLPATLLHKDAGPNHDRIAGTGFRNDMAVAI